MAQTVLDSNNLDAVIKDATGEGLTEVKLPTDSGVQTQIDAEAAKILKDVAVIDAETDDVEGEDGLTPKEKRELTDKMQKAIAKRTRALREAEEFAAEQYNNRRLAEAKALQLEAELAQAKAKPVEPVPEKTEPTRDQFKTDQEFLDAQVDWKVEQRFKAHQAEEAKRQAEAKQAEILAHAKARIEKAIELQPDFKDVTQAVDWPTPPAVANYMQESPLFAEIGYYLAKHPEARELIDSLHWTRQLVEIGKIESKLQPFSDKSSGKEPTDKVTPPTASTNGATPSTDTGTDPSPRPTAPIIRPLSSSGASQVEKPESEMSGKEALAAWSKKKGVNFNRRARH